MYIFFLPSHITSLLKTPQTYLSISWLNFQSDWHGNRLVLSMIFLFCFWCSSKCFATTLISVTWHSPNTFVCLNTYENYVNSTDVHFFWWMILQFSERFNRINRVCIYESLHEQPSADWESVSYVWMLASSYIQNYAPYVKKKKKD